ncbi:class I SAM-dependent methyltransferase [Streptomyces sp. NBC_01242]|uniref:class I SAM-dependent methyltransferase n=1 Tax=unclassified Streptomyces TaxID=2593676 RepID=UPI0022598F8C|nr:MULTISPECIES: class I SAM-dependent methyltransferase [unclassified Streptomyces]MCX4795226.1 class I SAM-dependent methyltransferase [Streptomyces sp. NBC_01242]WSJ36539.1 class I SAM-dependent methyltransferase [Streptomyces sp. NBC_01321]
MPTPDPKFDGLADDYDRTRPRYPAELFAHAVALLPERIRPTVVDAGAGTGIALEALVPLLPAGAAVHAVDISDDMIRRGKAKFPQVIWEQSTAEEYLGRLSPVDLVLAAQAYQWMDRPAYLAAAVRALRSGGVCMVVQNNRDYGIGGFAAEYEDLLEELSPGYHRTYRAIDVARELSERFDRVERRECQWRQALTAEEFTTMSSSSTQAQRAIAAVGPVFLERVRALCARYEEAGKVQVPYLSEAFYGIARG